MIYFEHETYLSEDYDHEQKSNNQKFLFDSEGKGGHVISQRESFYLITRKEFY